MASGYIFTSPKKVTCRLKEYDVYLNKKLYYGLNEPLSEQNNIPFGHNYTNPITPFTLKSTSKLRSFLHFRYSIVIHHFIPPANAAQF